MALDSRTLANDHFPLWAEEPPVPSEGSLVSGSQFHEEQWIMAAGMPTRGSSFLYVARAMGCSRTTPWRGRSVRAAPLTQPSPQGGEGL